MVASFLLASVALVQTASPFADIEKNYGLKVEIAKQAFTVRPARYSVSGDAPTAEQVQKYAALFNKEWSIYPPTLIKKAKVSRIVICVNLKVGEQIRGAVPAFEIDTMFYDPALGDYAPNYQRTVVHHEFFHMMDQRMGAMRKDPEWAALNPQGFSYGTGGQNMRDGNAGTLRKDIPGFLTQYGTAAVEEDKAELFGHLIVNNKFVTDQAIKDAVLAGKIALLKKRLEKFDPDMGEKFWGKVDGDQGLPIIR